MMSVYSGMTQQELDREYSPSSRAPEFLEILASYRSRSDQAKAELRCELDVRYGPLPDETLHFFPAARPDAPLQVFVHGGHWQESTKDDSCFAAPGFVEAGAAFVALGYGLAPDHSMATMVASVRRGIGWLGEHAAELGTRADRIFASGSSAGAHLVAASLAATPGGKPVEVAGASLLSGVYDLEPVRFSYVNEAVDLDAAAARDHSPVYHLPLRTQQVIVARGLAETDEYSRQHTLFVKALQERGSSVVDLVDPMRNHFDLPFDLGDRSTALGGAVLAQMGLA